MAKTRKFVAYRRLERPYTRKSKYRAKSFVRSTPVCKIVRHVMGNPKRDDFTHKLLLRSKETLQIRDISLEAARLTSNRYMEKNVGKPNYKYMFRVYPHHHLRENPLAAGAGADRMSTGMKMSFGKVIGIAARIKEDQPIFELNVNKQHVKAAKEALRRAGCKLPKSCYVEIIDTTKVSKPIVKKEEVKKEEINEEPQKEEVPQVEA